MKIFADLHIHSKHSRATSKDMDMEHLTKYAKIKGINLLGTGDFTHPLWIRELKNNLTEDGSGVLKTKDGLNFLLQTEISLMYTQDSRSRKVHNLILAPDFEIVEQINTELLKRGRLDYDGRPIFGFTCVELVEMMKNIDKRIEIIPAHAWTPWFGLLGSKSGFDSVEGCFQEQAKHIFALETGLSSDPAMNWRLSGLDKYALISNSDSHSFWPWRIGREANIFDFDKLTYDGLIKAIKNKDSNHFLSTIEVDPSYGKYHYDGHRACNVCMTPSEALKNRDICPVCKKEMTIGVLHRVEELADRPEGFKPKNAIPFKKLLPLSEIISAVTGVLQLYSKTVWEIYNKLIMNFDNEFNVLLNVNQGDLSKVSGDKIAKAVIDNREEKIRITPGYDGVYGRAVFDENERVESKTNVQQKSLLQFGG